MRVARVRQIVEARLDAFVAADRAEVIYLDDYGPDGRCFPDEELPEAGRLYGHHLGAD
jgi:hypothetical protein